MTHDELIEKTRAGLRWVLADVKPGTRVHELTDEEVEELARAAIRVIAPAVLEEVAYCAAATNANCYGDPTDVYETMIDAIRAMTTRYEQ